MFLKTGEVSEGAVDIKYLVKRTSYELKYMRLNFQSLCLLLGTDAECLKDLGNTMFEDSGSASLIQDLYETHIAQTNCVINHATIVSTYTFLETTLGQLCQAIFNNTAACISCDDLSSSNYIGRAIWYINITSSLDISVNTCPYYSQITQFQLLRNLIVHGNSTLNDPDPKKVRKLKTKFNNMFPSIDVASDNSFYISRDSLVNEFFEVVCDFLDFIFSEVSSKAYKLSREILECK